MKQSENEQVVIYNILGQEVYRNRFGNPVLNVNTAEWNKGTYFLRADYPSGTSAASSVFVIQ